MSTLSLSFLGPFQASLDGRPLAPFRTSKVQALLAYLVTEAALRPEAGHRREALMALLWPGMPEPSAHQNLRQTLYRLRLAIPAVATREGEGTVAFLLADRQTVQVNPAATYYLDLAVFIQLLGPAAAQPALAQATALYRGDFLADFYLPDSNEFEVWAASRRAQLRQQMLEALNSLTNMHLEEGEYEQAEALARRQLELDNLRESAHRQLMTALAEHGRRRQALSHYETGRQLLLAELGIEPSAETQALYEAIRAGRLDRRAAGAEAQRSRTGALPVAPPHNLPHPATPFIGREAELVALDKLLSDPTTRLVTIVAPGGMGKTRLALAAAERQLEAQTAAEVPYFPNGVYFISLASLTSAEQIIPTIGAAMNFSCREGRGLQEQLLDYLRQKQLLLLMDNFEHLLSNDVQSPDGTRVLADILQAASGVRVLVTSRERLRLQEEQVYPLQGLAFPDWEAPLSTTAVADTVAYPAIQLFLQSARRIQGSFELPVAGCPTVARICQLVEGMPLAIELAAAWIDTLSLSDIAAEIQQGLDFLATDVRNVPERHRSMRAVFDVTWQRLSPAEQEVFPQLSIFRGGFTRQAAQALTTPFTSMHMLSAFVSKSLLQYNRIRDRYQLHELLRQYAAEKLAQKPAVEAAVRDRHAAYYCLAMQQRAADLKGAQQQAALAAIEADIKNVQLAWEWAATQRQWAQLDQIVEALARFYFWRGRFQEGETSCHFATGKLAAGLLMPSGADQRLLARLLMWQSIFNSMLGHTAEASQQLQQSLDLLDSPSLDDQDTRPERALAWQQMGNIIYDKADYGEARRLYAQSLASYRALGDHWGVADVLVSFGEVTMDWGNYEEAEQLLKEGLALFQAWNDARGISRALLALGRTLRYSGHYDEARHLFSHSLEISQAQGNTWGIVSSIMELAFLALFQGEFWAGIQRLQDAVAISREIGDRERIAFALVNLSLAYCLNGDFAQAFALAEESAAVGEGQLHDYTFAILALAEADLHLGRYETTRAQSEKALTLAHGTGFKFFTAWAQKCQGWVALATYNYDLAYRCFQMSITSYPAAWQREWRAWAVAGLGRAAYCQGRQAEAQQLLYQALQIAVEIQAFIPLMHLIPIISVVLADEAAVEQKEQAIVLYSLATTHPFLARSRLFADIAGQQIAAVAATLPPAVVEAAQNRGRALDWWTTAAELLDELPKLGWRV